MRKSTSPVFAFAVAIAVLAIAQPGHAQGSDVIRIDMPGKASTAPQSINVLGDIVGIANDNAGAAHGFLFSDGEFTEINFPGFLQTACRGINNLGDIVGQYDNGPIPSPTKPTHGFLLSHEVFTTIDFPGATITGLFGINTHGEIVGNYMDAAFVSHGFIRDSKGAFVTVDAPDGVKGTVATGINDRGQVVGFYTDA